MVISMHASAYSALVAPASVAILGASNNPAGPTGRIQRYLLDRYGYPGKVYPVNPNRDTVQGIKGFSCLEDIGAPVDLAVVQSPAASVPGYIAECIRHEVKTALVLSSGFREVGPEGEALDRQILDLLKDGSTRVVGPNCVGVVSVRSNLAASIQTGLDQDRFELTDGSVGFLTQSGAMGAFTLNKSQGRGIGLSTMVSTGNELDVSYTEMLSAMIEDPLINGIVGYIEGVSDGEALIETLARARELGKPVGLMKVGKSAQGSAAVASHTGALAGVDEVYTAVFDSLGVQTLTSINELTDFTQMVNAGRPVGGPRVTMLTTSGGAGALSADYCEDLGLELAEWTGEWREKMAALLPTFAGLSNPIDMTGVGGRPEVLSPVLDLAHEHPGTDMVLLLLGNLEKNEQTLIELIRERVAMMDKPFALAWMGGTGLPLRVLPQSGIPSFDDPLPALKMLSWALTTGGGGTPSPLDGRRTRASSAPEAAREIISAARAAGRLQLDEHDAKRLIAAYGIPVTADITVDDPQAAVVAAREIGYPVVLKVLSHDIAHKTEIGGVELNLADDDEVLSAASRILTKAEQIAPETTVRLSVQPMVSAGLELLLGVKNDEIFGPVVMAGRGGIEAEVFDDKVLMIPPVTHALARENLSCLRLNALLDGYRNSEPLDVAGLASVIERLSNLALDLRDEVAELDINPFVVHAAESSSFALDAMVMLKPHAGDAAAAR